MSRRSIRKRRHLPLGGDAPLPGVASYVVRDIGSVEPSGVDMRTLLVGSARRAAFIIDGEEVDCGHVTPSMSTADVERQVRDGLAALAARAPKGKP